MSDRIRRWRPHDRKHFKRVEKRRQKSKLRDAPIPELNPDVEETTIAPLVPE